MRIFLLVLSWLFAMCAPAHALEWRGVDLDPRAQIRPQLLSDAIGSYEQHGGARLSGDTIVVVDFAKRSSEPRLYVLNLRSGDVRALLVAHGQGSDRNHDGVADFFSDEDGSHASSVGAFRAAERYQGGHGLSLRLDGLDSTNRSARPRNIVVHSQWYVSEQMVTERGVIGRSWGCFVVEPSQIDTLVSAMENGGFLYAGR